ncbi:radical SAM protein [Bacteroidales bacterium OttesenSCG-928-M06]|nr:radical SAM protein [Bacteroidales bacterium OttesenSCG-928-M06]
MPTFLIDNIIFGPINSRRLGISLGVNLLPPNRKICTFDCVYCECGFNKDGNKSNNKFPKREAVKQALEERLKEISEKKEKLDSITFSGNGEPTLHPEFKEVIEDTITLRDIYYPEAKISVFSNSTTISSPSVFRALRKIDNNILKLDAAFDPIMKNIDQPTLKDFNLEKLIRGLKKFNGNLIIQTIFLKGNNNGQSADNTLPENISHWVKLITEINPKLVMIYSLDRETPSKTLEKVSKKELEIIADKLREINIPVSVS